MIKLISAMLLSCSFSLVAQQAVEVQSTISGNQEQPKTIYVLPWQQPVGQIRIPATRLQPQPLTVSPLDRQQFLRFIAVQQATVQTRSVNTEKQQ